MFKILNRINVAPLFVGFVFLLFKHHSALVMSCLTGVNLQFSCHFLFKQETEMSGTFCLLLLFSSVSDISGKAND